MAKWQLLLAKLHAFLLHFSSVLRTHTVCEFHACKILSYLEVYLSIGQVISVHFMQEVDVFNEKVENWDDYFLPAAVRCLRSLCCSLKGCSIITKVAGWVHVVLLELI